MYVTVTSLSEKTWQFQVNCFNHFLTSRDRSEDADIIALVVLNKSSLLLRIILQNTQALKLFRMNMKKDVIYERH